MARTDTEYDKLREKTIQENIAFLKKKARSIDELLKGKNLSSETKNQLLQARKEIEGLYKDVRNPENYRKADYQEKQEGKPEFIFNYGQEGVNSGVDLKTSIQNIVSKVNFSKEELRAEVTDPDTGKKVDGAYLVDTFRTVAEETKKKEDLIVREYEDRKALMESKEGDTPKVDKNLEEAAKKAGNAIRKSLSDKQAEESAIVKNQEATRKNNDAKAVPVSGGEGVKYGGSGEPKVGDKMRLPTGSKRKGTSSVQTQYTDFTYTKDGWANPEGKVLDGATQEKITKAFNTPIGAKSGQYQYIGNGNWTNTNGYKGNTVNPSTAKELFLKDYEPSKVTPTDEKGGEGKKYTADVPQPNVPQRSTTGTGGRKGTGGGIVSKEAPTRETPTTEGIATKGLTGERVAHAMNRGFSGQKGVYFQPDLKEGSVKELVDTTNQEGGLKSALGKLSGLAEYAPDAFRMGLGLLGASEKVPEYEIPQEFMDYKSKLREMSTQGLSEQELANAYKDAERAYAYNVKGIRDMAGGRAGVGLANLGAATTNLGRAYENINVADAQMRRQNLGMYGSALGTYMRLDRQQFEDKQQLALANKQAGAQLAATALSDMQARADYNKTYGKGSIYEDYMKQMTEGLRLQNERYQYQLDNPLDLTQGTYAPRQLSTDVAVSPQNFRFYDDTYFNYNPNRYRFDYNTDE